MTMENVAKNIQDMYGREPIQWASDDYQKGYNAGHVDAVAELAKRLEVPLSVEDSRTVTRESLDLFLRLKDGIENRVGEVLHFKTMLETEKGYSGSIEKIEFEAGKVEVTTVTTYSCSCCRDEYDYYSFPIDYLFDDNYLDVVKAEVERRAEEAARKKQEEDERRQREREERERAEFERLQKKYGEGNQ